MLTTWELGDHWDLGSQEAVPPTTCGSFSSLPPAPAILKKKNHMTQDVGLLDCL